MRTIFRSLRESDTLMNDGIVANSKFSTGVFMSHLFYVNQNCAKVHFYYFAKETHRSRVASSRMASRLELHEHNVSDFLNHVSIIAHKRHIDW